MSGTKGNKMLNQLKAYKNGIFCVLLALSYLGVWHVSSRYTESGYLKEKQELTAKALDTTNQRLALAKMIGDELYKKLADRKPVQQIIRQETIHEIQKEPVYTDCRTTPTGVQLIERAIDNYGKPSGDVQVPPNR
jgi:hypothetical protein